MTRGIINLLAIALLASGPAWGSVPSFSKTFAPDTIGPGSTTTLTFLIVNGDPTEVSDLAFTDVLPAGVTIADPPRASTTCAPAFATLTAPAGGGTITLSDGRVGASKSCVVKVNVVGATLGTKMNVSGDLTSSAGNSGTAADDLMVVSTIPGFTKIFAPSTIEVGGRSTLTFTIDNTANAAAEPDIDFTDVLPLGMVVAGPSNATTTCGSPPTIVAEIIADPGTSVIDFSYLGTLMFPAVAAGASCTVSVDVTTTVAGSLGNVSGLLFTSTAAEAGRASATLVSTAAALGLQKKFLGDPVPVGGTVTLEFRIDNRNRDFEATGITFTDDLDFTPSMGITLTGGPFPDPPCGVGSAVMLAAGDVLTLTGGTLAPGAFCTFSVTLMVPVTETVGAHPNTTGAVSGTVDGSPVVGNTATDVLHVDTSPIFIKSFTDDPAGSGGTVTLEFTITNTDPGSALTDIAFTDDLETAIFGLAANSLVDMGMPDPLVDPCGSGSELTVSSVTIGMTTFVFPELLEFTGGSLAAAGTMGDSCTFEVELDVPIAPGGTYTNTTSSLTGDQGMTPITRGPTSGDLVILGAPRLTKEFTDDPVEPGSLVTLEFGLNHNIGSPGDATGITFTDDLVGSTGIAGLKAAMGELPKTDVCGPGNGTLTGSAGDTVLTFSGATQMPGDACTFSLLVEVPGTAPGGTFKNTTSGVGATVDGVASTSRPAQGDLVVASVAFTKAFTDDPVLPGGSVTLEFTLTNLGGSAVTDITFTDDLDEVVTGMAATGLPLADPCGSGSSLAGSFGDTLLTLAGGSLAAAGMAGDSCTFSVSLDVPGGADDGIFPNATGSLSLKIGGTPTLLPPAFDELTVESDLIFLTKEFTDDPVVPGSTVTLRFTLDNLDPDDPIASIAFTDSLESALSGLAATGLPFGACGGTVSTPDAGMTIDFSGGSLAAGGSCFFDVTLDVPAVAGGTSALNTTSTVSGLLGGLPVEGAAASDTLAINNLLFTKAFDGPTSPGGAPVLTFTITNVSTTESVSGLSFSDDLDDALTGLEATGLPAMPCGMGSSITGTSLLAFEGGTLPPEGVCSFDVDLSVPAMALPGDYVNETSPITIAGLPVSESAAATLTVLPSADLALVKTDATDPAMASGTLSYKLTVSNLGPGSAAAVVLTDALPPGTLYVQGSTGCTHAGGVVTCALGSMLAGASKTVSIQVFILPDALSPIENLATVSSATSDPAAGNNDAMISTDVKPFERFAVLDDVGGNGFDDVVYPILGPAVTYQIRDVGTKLKRFQAPPLVFPAGRTLVAFDKVPDLDGDGIQEIVAAARNDTTGNHVVRVLEAENGQVLSAFSLPPGLLITKLEVIDDNGAGDPLLAIGTHQFSNGVNRIRLRRASDGANLGLTTHNPVFLPIDIADLPSFIGDPGPELAVVGVRASNGVKRTFVRELSGALATSVLLPASLAPVDMEVAPDFGGAPAPELAILSLDLTLNKPRVFTIDADLGATVGDTSSFPAGAVPAPMGLAVMPDFGGTPAPELAVLYRTAAGKSAVRVRDAGDNSQLFVGAFGSPMGAIPFDLDVFPDFGGAPAPELAGYTENVLTGERFVTVRDGSTGAVLRSIKLP